MIARRVRIDRRTVWIGILDEEGLRTLRRGGHAAAAAVCAPDLSAADIRFVDESQRQTLEAAADAELRVLYVAPYPSRPLVTGMPVVEARAATIALRVQPDLACLVGHFPALPIVPGAAQLGWALGFGADILGLPPTMRSIRSVKFGRIIQPGRSLRLHIEVETGSPALRFEFASETGRHSTGWIETRGGDG